MKPIRRVIATWTAAGLTLLGSTLVADTASAAPLACGSVITASTTLTEDMTCPDGPGLIVMGSGVTLKLNGHTISAGPLETHHVGPYDPPGADPVTEYDVSFTQNDDAGIVVMGDGHTIRGPGTVTHFGAGMMLVNANGNTVDGVTVHENIGVAASSFFGDGIAINNSNNNVVKNSTVTNNGHYSGISLLGASSGNIVTKTLIKDNNHPELCGAEDQNFMSQGVLVNYCGPNTQGLPVSGARPGSNESRPPYAVVFQQNMGFRFEGGAANGDGATNNTLSSSTVTGSGNHGVLFGAYCNDPDCVVPGGEGNVRNTVQSNKVNANGFGSSYGPPSARMFGGQSGGGSGILWFVPSCCPLLPEEHPPGQETVTGNEVNGNARHGITVNFSEGNFVARNKAANNNAAPVVGGAATFNGHDTNGIAPTDGGDTPCDSNVWQYNSFGAIGGPTPPNYSVNQACVGAKPPKGGTLEHGADAGVSARGFARGQQGSPEEL